MFKIFKGLDDVKPSDFLLCQMNWTRGHQFKLYKPHAHLEIRRNFFSFTALELMESFARGNFVLQYITYIQKHLDCYFKNRGYD